MHPMMQANFMIQICRETQVDKSINFHHHTLIYLLSQHTTVDNVISMQYNKQCSVCNCLQQRSYLCKEMFYNNAHSNECRVSSALLHNVSFIYFYIFISGVGVVIFVLMLPFGSCYCLDAKRTCALICIIVLFITLMNYQI